MGLFHVRAVIGAFEIAHHDAGKFRTGGAIGGLEVTVVAVEDALGNCPGHRLDRVVADAVGVGEGRQVGLGLRLVLIAPQDRCDLLAGHIGIRCELVRQNAEDDAVRIRPDRKRYGF